MRTRCYGYHTARSDRRSDTDEPTITEPSDTETTDTSLPIIDLWKISGIQPEIEIIKEKYCPDGLHPNDDGHRRMAEIIEASLLSI